MLYFCTFKGVKEWLLKSAGAPRTNGKSQKDPSPLGNGKGPPERASGACYDERGGQGDLSMAYSHVEAQGDETKGNPLLPPLQADLKNRANDFSEGFLPKPTLYHPQTSSSLIH
jgi:hypothetical protein